MFRFGKGRRNLVSFNCNGNSKKHTARQTDVGETVKYRVEGEESGSRAAQGHRNQEEAAGQESDIRQTKARQKGGEYSLGLPDVGCIKACYMNRKSIEYPFDKI